MAKVTDNAPQDGGLKVEAPEVEAQELPKQNTVALGGVASGLKYTLPDGTIVEHH